MRVSTFAEATQSLETQPRFGYDADLIPSNAATLELVLANSQMLAVAHMRATQATPTFELAHRLAASHFNETFTRTEPQVAVEFGAIAYEGMMAAVRTEAIPITTDLYKGVKSRLKGKGKDAFDDYSIEADITFKSFLGNTTELIHCLAARFGHDPLLAVRGAATTRQIQIDAARRTKYYDAKFLRSYGIADPDAI